MTELVVPYLAFLTQFPITLSERHITLHFQKLGRRFSLPLCCMNTGTTSQIIKTLVLHHRSSVNMYHCIYPYNIAPRISKLRSITRSSSKLEVHGIYSSADTQWPNYTSANEKLTQKSTFVLLAKCAITMKSLLF